MGAGTISAEAIEEMKDHPAKTGGGNWVADEMHLEIKGKKAYLWDIMDRDTRYVLASHLSYRRDGHAARAMLRKALAASDGPPKTITTDKWRAYIKPIKDLSPETKHIQSQGLAAEVNNNLSERLQGTYRDRTKTLRGLENIESGQRYLDGWTLNYNLFRKHESLKNKPPASKALKDPPLHRMGRCGKRGRRGAAIGRRSSTAGRRAEGGTQGIEAAQADENFAGVGRHRNGGTACYQTAESQSEDASRHTEGAEQETASSGEGEEQYQAQPT